jgi:hypothetical protein
MGRRWLEIEDDRVESTHEIPHRLGKLIQSHAEIGEFPAVPGIQQFRTTKTSKSFNHPHLMYAQTHKAMMFTAMISVMKLQNVSKANNAKIPLKM